MKVDLKQEKPIIISGAANEARKAYKREWNRKNRDKVKEYQARYWEKKAQEAANLEADPGALEG